MCDQVDELALEPVRVLELVHHHHPEAKPCLLANSGVVPKQVAGRQLEVLEVHHGFAPLRLRVLRAETFEQLLQELAVVRRQLLERCALRCLARLLEGRCTHASAGKRREVDVSFRR